jgi:hypothetical protein
MKAILALASLCGVALKGDETEDQIAAAVQAHKPAPQKIELNLEDAETKAHFEGLVTTATKPLNGKIEALEALIKNGAAGSAGAGSPVPVVTPTPAAPTMTRAAFNQLPHAERNAFMASKGKLEN